MAENLVSQPPLNTPLVDGNGMPTRALAIWMRDVYRRVAYKGGNAIDDNKAETDEALIGIGSTLEETIVQVNENIEGISLNAENLESHEALEEAHGSNGNVVGFNDIATVLLVGLVNQMALVNNAVDSTVSVTSPNATTSTVSVTSPDATISTVSVDSPSVATAPAVYDQAFTDTIVTLVNELKSDVNQIVADVNPSATLVNELKADVNQLVTDVNPSATLSNELKADVNQMVTDINASIAQLNELLANSKTSGQMTT